MARLKSMPAASRTPEKPQPQLLQSPNPAALYVGASPALSRRSSLSGMPGFSGGSQASQPPAPSFNLMAQAPAWNRTMEFGAQLSMPPEQLVERQQQQQRQRLQTPGAPASNWSAVRQALG